MIKKSLLVTILLSIPFFSMADELLKIAVSPLAFQEGDTIGQTLSDTVLDTLTLTLDESPFYQTTAVPNVIDLVQMEDLCRNSQCHYLISGRLGKTGTSYILSLMLYDYQDNAINHSMSVGVESLLDIFQKTDLVVSSFLGRMEYFTIDTAEINRLYSEGSGTSVDPYGIRSAADLVNISFDPTAFYILLEDIDLSGSDWIPIPSFSGYLDGNGYQVSHLNIQEAAYENTGLFGIIEESGTVSNLVIADAVIRGIGITGSLCGWNKGWISGCGVSGVEVEAEYSVGGLCGRNDGVIEDSYAESTILCHIINGGGFIGYNWGTVVRCGSRSRVVNDNIHTYSEDFYRGKESLTYMGKVCGGFLGSNGNSGLIDNCYTFSEVEVARGSSGVFIGYIDGSVRNCYSVGSIDYLGDAGGGFTGGVVSGGSIENCYCYTEVRGEESRGSFIGVTDSRISSCLVFLENGRDNPGNTSGFTFGGASPGVLVSRKLDKFLDVSRNPYKRWDFETVWEMTARGPILRNAPYPERQDPIGYWTDE